MTSKLFYRDAFNALCGPKLGEGLHRTVFLCAFDPTLVIKVENTDWPEHKNIAEFNNWQENCDAPTFGKWLAPCVRISPEGRVLIQKRTEPIHHRDLPAMLPAFLTDIKQENFGWYDGRIVAHDYPRLNGPLSKRLRKADWR